MDNTHHNIPTLRKWVSSVLDDNVDTSSTSGMTAVSSVPSWEVTPETTAILSRLYTRHTSTEADTDVIMEALKTATAEYDGERKRLESVLISAGPGVGDTLRQGPAQSHVDNIVGVCSVLDMDSCMGAGLHLALSEILVRQTQDITELSKQRTEVDSLKASLVGFYEKLSKSKEEVAKAKILDREQTEVTAQYNKKIEFLGKKCIEYRRNIEKKEAILIKNGGNDPSIRHREIVKLKDNLLKLDEDLKPLSRQLQGFLSLPPSVDMARLELAKCELELEQLDRQLTGSISDLHL